MGIEFDRLLAQARRAERVRGQSHRREAERQRGVAWSGLGPGAFVARTDAALADEAAGRLRALEIWRASGEGRLQRVLSDVQRTAESLRAMLARAAGDMPPLTDLSSGLAALSAAARQAEALMDDATANALSGEACATSIASSSPSTASPSSSAS